MVRLVLRGRRLGMRLGVGIKLGVSVRREGSNRMDRFGELHTPSDAGRAAAAVV